MRKVTSIQEILDEKGIRYKRYNGYLLGECPVCGGGKRTPCCSYKEEGVWKCHSCGSKGGMKKLIEILQLDIVPERFSFQTQKIRMDFSPSPKDITKDVFERTKESADAMSYKYLHSRGINLRKVSKYVRFIKKGWYYEKGFRLVIPAIDQENKIRGAKIRRVFESDVDTKVLSWRGGEQYSIGLKELKGKEFVLIVEGEIDFLSVKTVSPEFPVLGIPSANYKFKDERKGIPNKVFLLLDNDEAGDFHSKRLEYEISLWGKKVEILRYPEGIKDFNEWILKNPQEAYSFLKRISI